MERSLVLAIFAFLVVANAAEGARPNILYIMSDDHAAHAISAYGGRLAEIAPTPNIDRLANEGALFTNAFCTNSICSPSRACVLTGQYGDRRAKRTHFGKLIGVENGPTVVVSGDFESFRFRALGVKDAYGGRLRTDQACSS
jgi:hypothetical protein